jgi:hypothetical protein
MMIALQIDALEWRGGRVRREGVYAPEDRSRQSGRNPQSQQGSLVRSLGGAVSSGGVEAVCDLHLLLGVAVPRQGTHEQALISLRQAMDGS